MSYIIKHCSICGKEYHIHKSGKVKGACEHIRMGRIRGKKTFLATVDTKELDELIEEEHKKSKGGK